MRVSAAVFLALSANLFPATADAHKLAAANVPAKVAKSTLTVTPSIDWNSIGNRQGKQSEVWTLDGEALNEVTFFSGLKSGATLGRAEKHTKLPALQSKILLVELPDILEQTYRASRNVKEYRQLTAKPRRFLGNDGIDFEYEYVNADGLHVRGNAVATLSDGSLFMINMNAPKLYYFNRTKPAFDAIVNSARLK